MGEHGLTIYNKDENENDGKQVKKIQDTAGAVKSGLGVGLDAVSHILTDVASLTVPGLGLGLSFGKLLFSSLVDKVTQDRLTKNDIESDCRLQRIVWSAFEKELSELKQTKEYRETFDEKLNKKEFKDFESKVQEYAENIQRCLFGYGYDD